MLPYNSVLASFFILAWLIFTPSAWRRYVASFDPDLSPDFALFDLKARHWREPKLRRVLYLGHGLGAVWASMTVALLLWFLGLPGQTLLFASVYAFSLSLVGGILGSFFISVVFGLTAGAVGGILLSLPIGMADEVIFSMAENIAITVMLSVSDAQLQLREHNLSALLIVLLSVFTASLAGNVMYSTTKTAYSQPPHRQIGSVVVGVLISSLVMFLIIELVGMLAEGAARLMESGTLFSLVYDSLISTLFGVAFAFIWIWHTWRWQQGLLLGLSISLLLSLPTVILNQFQAMLPINTLFITAMQGGIENALLYIVLFAFPYGLAKYIANPWAGIIAGVFGSAGVYIAFTFVMSHDPLLVVLSTVFLAAFLGFSAIWWRPLLFYPLFSAWNLLLHRADEKQEGTATSLWRWHSAAWDEHQYLPLFGLESYLVMVAERNASEGRLALEYFSNTRQSWAAQEAQIELDARRLQSYQTVQTLSSAHKSLAAGELSSPVGTLLRSFSRTSRDIEAALAQESSYNQRLALDAVEERLDGLVRELTRSSEPYALRFRPIAVKWRQILAEHVRQLSETVESRQEIVNPYIIGIPLTEHQEIFVGRSDVSERIEKLLLDLRCPPLLLYGQRRTGKTSLLNNLGKLLPWKIVPLFVDLQGPASLAKDYPGFLYNISRAMTTSAKRHRELVLPPLTRDSLIVDPFTRFDEWLDEIEHGLDTPQTILLTLDEFSTLEHVFDKGLLDEASVLGMFRHIIQHRPRIKILLSGSHTLDEFERWASYLINVQTVHISYLNTHEALQLIEQPVKDFALSYTEQARQRILTLTHSHPALIQLLCAEIVNIKNKQTVIAERRLAQLQDVEAAIPGALQHGRFFFADIAKNQVSEQGLALLQFIAQQGEGQVIDEETLLTRFPQAWHENVTHLLQRELIEATADGYRFQIELTRRWFA